MCNRSCSKTLYFSSRFVGKHDVVDLYQASWTFVSCRLDSFLNLTLHNNGSMNNPKDNRKLGIFNIG
jgi:hypothetical protein